MKTYSLLLGLFVLTPVLTVNALSDTGSASQTLPTKDAPETVPWLMTRPAERKLPVVLAQSGGPEIRQLQEEIRALNGRIEELSFQLLQMQEQIRKMQEDNEFRFQELEEKRSDLSDPDKRRSQPPRLARNDSQSSPGATALTATGTTSVTEDGPDASSQRRGAPPRLLGSLRVDGNGTIVNAEGRAETARHDADLPPGTDGTTVAALPTSQNPRELYSNAYEFILSGDYRTAESGFREYIAQFPDSPKSADAHYWLGEALLGQQKYQEAAEVFLTANRAFGQSRKAPEMLLKLGVSLAAIDQRDVACATFTEMRLRYPDTSQVLSDRVRREQQSAGC